MPFVFKPVRGDVLLRASFAQPEFRVLNALPVLYSNTFKTMARYGLQLQDMKIEQGTGNFSEFQLNMFLNTYAAAIRLRLDRFEVQSFDFLKVSPKQVLQLAADFGEALSLSTETPIQCQAYSLTLDYHGNPGRLRFRTCT